MFLAHVASSPAGRWATTCHCQRLSHQPTPALGRHTLRETTGCRGMSWLPAMREILRTCGHALALAGCFALCACQQANAPARSEKVLRIVPQVDLATGRVVEQRPAVQVFHHPQHQYCERCWRLRSVAELYLEMILGSCSWQEIHPPLLRHARSRRKTCVGPTATLFIENVTRLMANESTSQCRSGLSSVP
jgi:hypothetical protein